MNKDINGFTELFIENAVIHGESTINGDSKRGNKASDKLYKIFIVMKEDRELAEEMLDILLCHTEPNVIIWACGIALDIEYKSIKVENMLKKLAHNNELGILSFNAEMILKVREGQGLSD
ncbi:hypothetical protein [Metabacillus endolithicus]|uniref:DUF2019 domain-containing protein n=1 Tax=Metabacillus endolithicus TaxID=1535204 RepID=A0ABW5C3P4_9BACI|nr:hypothetical protein [Metabacillus endolithicus]UPG66219.1 hypothetical protein MVE64_26280 [Metabacillus endolithicus]